MMEVSKKGDKIRIYNVFFDPNISQEARQILNKEQISSILSREQWLMGFGKFIDGQSNKLFPFILTASCKRLNLSDAKFDKILMNISRPKFYELKMLFLSHNNISSIEQLQFINMPFLESLQLDFNNIIEIRALNKCVWKFLQKLSFVQNPIQQFLISRLQIKQNISDSYWMQQECRLAIKQRSKNIETLAKCKFNRIEQLLQYDGKNFAKVMKSLKRKGIYFC